MVLHPVRRRRFAQALPVLTAVICAAWIARPGAAADLDPISWRGDYAGAFEEARSADRLLWIQFTGPWCPNCTRMEHDSFPDPDIIRHARRSFVPLKLRSDVHEQLALAFNLSGLPATVIVAPTREILAVRQGYLGPDELDQLLSDVSASRRGRKGSPNEGAAGSPPGSPGPTGTETTRPKTEERLALSGYCPVSLIAGRRLVPGQAEYTVQHEGRVYRFASSVMSNLFRRDPARYVPVNRGDCPVAQVDRGLLEPGNPKWGVLYQNRLFLCGTEEARGRFLKEPERYAMVDVAEQGFCPHCLGQAGLLVRGNPQYDLMREGRRYWFPDPSHRDAFVAAMGASRTRQ